MMSGPIKKRMYTGLLNRGDDIWVKNNQSEKPYLSNQTIQTFQARVYSAANSNNSIKKNKKYANISNKLVKFWCH